MANWKSGLRPFTGPDLPFTASSSPLLGPACRPAALRSLYRLRCRLVAYLALAFRSAVLPLKAIATNLLSMGAAYGLLQLVFQRGLGSSLLRFTPESGVAGWVPIFLFALLFGLSMDYEVLLLSRSRESVVFGLARTGRLISSTGTSRSTNCVLRLACGQGLAPVECS